MPFEAGRTYLLGRVEARGSVHLVLPPGAVLLASAQVGCTGTGGLSPLATVGLRALSVETATLTVRRIKLNHRALHDPE